MIIMVNGERRQVTDGATVAALLAELGLRPAGVAVEHNGTVVPRGRLAGVTLADGDRLELIRAVAGG